MMKCARYLFYFLVSFLLLFPAANSFAAVDLGPFSIGGAIRANYVIGDYTPELDRASGPRTTVACLYWTHSVSMWGLNRISLSVRQNTGFIRGTAQITMTATISSTPAGRV